MELKNSTINPQKNFNQVLSNQDIHIWMIAINESEETFFWSLLNDQEKEKANRYKISKPRREFIITRGLLKKLLGQYLSLNVIEINLEVTDHGKPFFKNAENIYFNISHSENLGVIAFTKNSEMGVDVEYMEEIKNYEDLVKRFFSKAEYEQFTKLKKNMQKKAFYTAWTKKEAYIKAIGYGFHHSLASFVVSFDQGHEEYKYENVDWNLFTDEIKPGYMFSVMKKGMINKIEYFLI